MLYVNPTNKQVHSDFYFVKPKEIKIVDIKLTYRRDEKAKFGFSGGSFTTFMRKGIKNIVGDYSDYDDNYILGCYTDEFKPITGKVYFENLDSIISLYNI